MLEKLEARLSDYISMAVPWVGLLIVLPVAGSLLHILWDDHIPMWIAMMISGALISYTIWIFGRGSLFRRVLNVATSAFVSLFLVLVTIFGLLSWVGNIFLWAAPTLAILHDILIGVHADDDEGDSFIARWKKGSPLWGLDGSRIRKLKEANPFKTVYKAVVNRNRHTSRDVLNVSDRIAAANRTAKNNVSVSEDPDDNGSAYVTVVSGDLEKRRLDWEGPSRPGKTMMDPIHLGLRIDGEPAEIIIPGHHVQIMGMPGSGKSFGAGWNILSEAMTRTSRAGRTEIWAVDVTKDNQTFGDMEPALDRVAYDRKSAETLIREIIADVPKRTKLLSEEGFKAWDPKSSKVRFRLVFLEEAPDIYDLMEDPDGADMSREEITRLFQVARSAGISIVSSLQIATDDQQPKGVWRAMDTRICFGVASSRDGSYGLREEAERAGADPSKWGAEEEFRGMCYVNGEGMPRQFWHVPVRTRFISNLQMKEHSLTYPAPNSRVDREEEPEKLEDDLELNEEDDGVSIDDEMESSPELDALDFEVEEVEELPEEDARTLILNAIQNLGTGAEFSAVDIRDVWSKHMTRQGAFYHLKKLTKDGVIQRSSEWGKYRVL